MSTMAWFFTGFGIFAAAFGACIASFMNVCIWRIPRGESVVWPPSHCPKCQAPIRWYQNLPIVSWCALRGKCARCHAPISPRYVLVEALGAVLFLLVYLQWAVPFMFRRLPPLGLVPVADPAMMAVEGLVIAGLILGSFIDLAEQWLPDRVTIGGMLLGVPLSALVPEMQGETARMTALLWSLGGLAFGFLFLWGIGKVFSALFKKEAMGFGDVKLMGAIGAFFGPGAALFTLIVSSLVGSLVGGVMLARGRAHLGGFTAVPYGPFLAFGVLVWMYFGPVLWAGYMQLFAK